MLPTEDKTTRMPTYTGTKQSAAPPAMVAWQPKQSAKPARASLYHGQGKIGSVPRTQYYLASSGDYTPEALRKIYNTPTTSQKLPDAIAGDYNHNTNQIRLNDRLNPLGDNYVLRHETSHMFDKDQYLNRGWLYNAITPDRYESDVNGFSDEFASKGNYMPYPPGRSDVAEARAAVSMEPGRYKGLEKFYPEFTPEAWKKKIQPIWPNDMGLTAYNKIENLRTREGNRTIAMPAYTGAPTKIAVK